MRLEEHRLEEASRAGGPATREDAQARVRRFALLRAAQRALAPSSREPMGLVDADALAEIRERLNDLVQSFEAEIGPCEPDRADQTRSQDDLVELDRAMDGYTCLLLANLESLPFPQLRASLTAASEEQRAEVLALLELCMGCEPVPAKYLHIVDFLVTLLSSAQRDGTWMLETDPANLSDAVRQRCWEAGSCGAGTEAGIAQRFQHAAERLANGQGTAEILAEMSRYKAEIAGFFFVPAVLRCVVGYNVVAKNHFDEQLRRGRELDSAIDDEMESFSPHDAPTGEPAADDLPRGMLQAHESPGVLAVQEAIQQRLLDAGPGVGAAARIAAHLDLAWLEPLEREAFLSPEREGAERVIRMTVVLGQLAVTAPDCRADFSSLSIHEAQLDAWICALGEEVQEQINTLIRDDYEQARRLGDTKSRFLQAVLLVARRRHDPSRKRWTGSEEADSFDRDAISLLREYLEREQFRRGQRIFFDLLGGGWRRTAAFAAVGLCILWLGIRNIEPDRPRSVREFSERQARDISPLLAGAYRDYAQQGSMFVAIVGEEWLGMSASQQRIAGERISTRLTGQKVHEVLLFDPNRVLVAHYKQGSWRTPVDWNR